jgi:hypothetical protein
MQLGDSRGNPKLDKLDACALGCSAAAAQCGAPRRRRPTCASSDARWHMAPSGYCRPSLRANVRKHHAATGMRNVP